VEYKPLCHGKGESGEGRKNQKKKQSSELTSFLGTKKEKGKKNLPAATFDWAGGGEKKLGNSSKKVLR